MRIRALFAPAMVCTLFWATPCGHAAASDACSTRAVITAADVTASDGKRYKMESWFHASNAAAVRFIRDGGGVLAVEGPFAWSDNGSGARLAATEREAFAKVFALGHQFHAFLIFFDEIMGDVRPAASVAFQGGTHRSRRGNYPYGGTVDLIQDPGNPRSAGMKLLLDDSPPMEITFGDWREAGGRSLPFLLRIDDGSRIFEYSYTKIDIGEKPPLWFMETVAAEGLDQIGIYRLHRRILAAHCLGDAAMMASLTAPQFLSAGKGELSVQRNADVKAMFEKVFGNLRYSEYQDLSEPVIEVSADGTMGWAGVTVRAAGTAGADETPFDDQWAWIMLARKAGNRWLNAGIAANRREKK